MIPFKKIRVLIADDHQILRQGIKKILEDTRDIEAAGEAKSGIEVLQKIHEKTYDVLLLDISMPNKGGIDILDQVRRKCPAMSVLVLSTHPEEQYAVPAIRAGAAGYLTKESAPESLVLAIRQVARGLKYISTNLAARLAEVVSQPDRIISNPHERLSARERQVMIALAQGCSLTKIAQNIDRSVKTVSTYRGRVLDKMQLSNNAELTRYALIHNLI